VLDVNQRRTAGRPPSSEKAAQKANTSSPFYDVKALGYNASKTALNMFTVDLAYDLRDTQIKVNSACPG